LVSLTTGAGVVDMMESFGSARNKKGPLGRWALCDFAEIFGLR